MKASAKRRQREELTAFSAGRIALPVLVGLAVVCYLVYQEIIRQGLSVGELIDRIPLTRRALGWLVMAGLMMALREFGYMWQVRILTDRKLSWWASFEVIWLWNFFAAVSPSMVGGAAVAVFMLCKEKLTLGRSTAIVFTTVFLDQFFFMSIPVLVAFVMPFDHIFAPIKSLPSDVLGSGAEKAFWTVWAGVAAYVAFLIAALFVAPHLVNGWLQRFFHLPWLRRWRTTGLHMADELLIASDDLRRRSTLWWTQAWAATSVAWVGRYMVLNCVLAAFANSPMGLAEHAFAAGRQAVLWMVMVIAPTPGGSGIAELGFSWLFKDLVPAGAALTVAIIWRLVSYYPYLFLGVPVMTQWIKRVYGRDVRQPKG